MRPGRPAPLLCRGLTPLHACTLYVLQGYRPHQPLRLSRNTVDPGGLCIREPSGFRQVHARPFSLSPCCSCFSFLPPRRAGLPIVAGDKLMAYTCVIYYLQSLWIGISYSSLFPYLARNASLASSGVMPFFLFSHSQTFWASRLRYRFVSSHWWADHFPVRWHLLPHSQTTRPSSSECFL